MYNRYFNRWKERNQIHFSFEGGKYGDTSSRTELGKKRIKLATDTAANVVQERSFVRDHPVKTITAVSTSVHNPVIDGGNDTGSKKRPFEEDDVLVANVGAEEKEQAVPGLTGLRRRRIILQVPLYYSCRMQKTLPNENLAYYIPLVEHAASHQEAGSQEDVDHNPTLVETLDSLVPAAPVPDDNTDDASFPEVYLQPIVQPPALVVGDNAVPVVTKWLCCVQNVNAAINRLENGDDVTFCILK